MLNGLLLYKKLGKKYNLIINKNDYGRKKDNTQGLVDKNICK